MFRLTITGVMEEEAVPALWIACKRTNRESQTTREVRPGTHKKMIK
jgi:hypothetical protein